jgi:hypothetical protein
MSVVAQVEGTNLIPLRFVHDTAFVRQHLEETRLYILPYAAAVSPDMFRELSDLVENREALPRLRGQHAGP